MEAEGNGGTVTYIKWHRVHKGNVIGKSLFIVKKFLSERDTINPTVEIITSKERNNLI